MVIKVLSLFKVADDSSKETGFSAFGRCVAEMTMVPTFFLDYEKVNGQVMIPPKQNVS